MNNKPPYCVVEGITIHGSNDFLYVLRDDDLISYKLNVDSIDKYEIRSVSEFEIKIKNKPEYRKFIAKNMVKKNKINQLMIDYDNGVGLGVGIPECEIKCKDSCCDINIDINDDEITIHQKVKNKCKNCDRFKYSL